MSVTKTPVNLKVRGYTHEGVIEMTVNLVDEFEAALTRTGWTRAKVAERLKVGKAAISNWFARGDMPVNQLQKIVLMLDDYDFAAACSEATFHIRVHSEQMFKDTPEARYFTVAKEESERKALDERFKVLTGVPRQRRTDNQRRQMLGFLKELSDEIEEENKFKAAIMEDWDISMDEVS